MVVTPGDLLEWIALAAVLGVTGQLARTLIGFKKTHGSLEPYQTFSEEFNVKRLVASVLLAVLVGGVAGVLASIRLLNGGELPTIEEELVWSLILVGYAGTDFIEGVLDIDWDEAKAREDDGDPPDPGLPS